MAYWWTVQPDYHYTLKRGMVGPEVAALQTNLGVQVDGDFGRITEDRVIAYQKDEFPDPDDHDGIAGGKTMQRMVVQGSLAAAEKHNVPKLLLKSLAVAETNFIIGAVASHPNDPGWDLGPYQLSSGSLGTPLQSQFERAFNIASAADWTAAEARGAFDLTPRAVPSRYLDELAHGDQPKFKWCMVALNHNWPAAAYWIPRRGHIYIDPARDDQWTEWISRVTRGRLTTPRQWVAEQVHTKTVYMNL